MPVNTLIQIRRGNESDWSNAPEQPGRGVLYQGELGLVMTSGDFKLKVGDGEAPWSSLPYLAVPLNSGNFIAGSGITIEYDQLYASGLWKIDETWLDNFIANSSGALNVEGVQDIIGNSGVVGGFGINKSYDDPSGFTTVSVTGMTLRVEESTGIGVSGSVENYVVNGETLSNNVYTISVTGIEHTLVNDWTEAVQDTIGTNAGSTGFLVNGTGVAWTYDDNANTLEVAVTGIPHTLITDWDAAISGNIDTQLLAGTGIVFTYDSGNNTLTIATAVLDDTHTHIWDNITDAKTKATLTELGYLSGVVPGTASADRAVVLDSSKDITGINNLSTIGNVIIGGDLTVAGTSTVVDSTIVNIGDNIIAVNTSGLATGGLEVRNSGTSDYKQFVWDNIDGRWEVGDENLQANQFISTIPTVSGSPLVVTSSGLVTNLNVDYLDGEHGAYYLDWDNFTDVPTPDITVALSGDVAGSSTVSNWNLSDNLSISINAIIQPNSVALSGDTTGDYVESINVAGTGLTIDITSGEAQKPTITSNATPDNISGTIVSRDSAGGFSAEVINAAGLSGTSINDPVYITYAVIDGGSP